MNLAKQTEMVALKKQVTPPFHALVFMISVARRHYRTL